MITKPLAFELNPNNIYILISKTEPFFGYLLTAINIKIGEYKGFKWGASSSNTIYLQKEYVDSINKDKSKLDEFISLVLHEIYHIYLNHSWRFGFHDKGLYFKYKDKANYLKPLINLVLDCIIDTSLSKAGYSFGELPQHKISDLLGLDHPRINDNWNEEELLLEVLNNSKYESQTNSITLPSGESISVDDINADLLDDESEDRSEVITSVAKNAANIIRNDSSKQKGKLSNSLLPPDIDIVKSSDLAWEDRLKLIAISSISNKLETDYNSIKEENFYSYEMGLSPFNRCSVEYNYKPKKVPDTVAVYIDLSGSIYSCPNTLSMFLDQISEIARSIGRLLLITFDSGITGSFIFDMDYLDESLGSVLLKEKEVYLKGGGGTDVIPLFQSFFDNYSECDLEEDIDTNNICMVVVLTDLYLEKPSVDLEPVNDKGVIPTIWVIPEIDYNENHSKVNFGEILVIK